MSESVIKYILIVVVAAMLAFLGGRMSKSCPKTDPALIEALTADIARRDTLIRTLGAQAVMYQAIADSLAKLPPQDVEDVLPRIPVGRNSAELDSIMSILVRPW